MRGVTMILAGVSVAVLAACSQPTQTSQGSSPQPGQPAGAPAQAAGLTPQQTSLMNAANSAAFTPAVEEETRAQPKPPVDSTAVDAKPGAAQAGPQPDPVLIRAQVMLDRTAFSPGAVDGLKGENMRQAIAAFEQANGMTVDGKLDQQVWDALARDTRPVLASYTITQADVQGPWTTLPPKDDYEAMAAVDRLGYQSPAEALAERFHMDEKLLRALNPGVDFTRPGVAIVVADPGDQALPAKVARIEVDKKEKAVRAYDEADQLIGFYPATIGSSDMPTPSGTWKVTAVQKDPVWNYDPAKLNFGKAKRKLTIPAGPNNPVGLVWIDLSKPTYGIHGTPDPEKIGKTDSHGCVRLTNWDALQLAAAVDNGIEVAFVTAPKKKASSKA
jgi:lipoprotein-anchoring transpeptidase ErfK/SrfK